jgi:hypothetical protein
MTMRPIVPQTEANGARVDIAMGTFNGAAYLPSQIDSILGQTHDNWRLLIRDDGSDDDTVSIIKDYCGRFEGRVQHIEDDLGRLGAKRNFSAILARTSADFVMFADQDDVWYPTKIQVTCDKARELQARARPEEPVLVFSDLAVVDSRGEPIARSYWRYAGIDPARCLRLNHLLVENPAPGCTMLMNRRLRELILPVPECAVMHDWYAMLTATCIGHVAFVPFATGCYRQHARNTIGVQPWDLRRALSSVREVRTRVRKIIVHAQAQAEEVLTRHGPRMHQKQLELIRDFVHLRGEGFATRKAAMLRHGFVKTALFKSLAMVLFG